ncbi:MAG: ACP S-malonyltransferase [Chloroflexi bacterium]|nr:ACP S-malonyltransferase [Chloroflexota bacterium]
MTTQAPAVVPVLPARIAFLFPGQGSQAVGMGRDLYLNSVAAREVFDEIDDTLGRKLSTTMFEGPDDVLRQTENTQPAILATSIATWRAMEEATGVLQIPNATAGHSLGEYSALAVSGVLSVTDAVKLVLERGRLMQGACQERPGGMAALIGIDEITAEEICRESGAEMSTINTEQQIILAGDHRSLAMAIDMASARGAKKAIPLQVGGAFHSGLMSPAQDGLNAMIDSLTFHDPLVPLIGNVTARSLGTAEEVREELRLQLTSCVQWNNTVKFMVNDGIQNFYEIGHGRILAGMVKRIHSEASVSSIGDFESVLQYASA